MQSLNISNFEELQQSFPKEAQLLQTLVTKSVSDVEHHFADLEGIKKAELATEQSVELLQKTYDGIDLFANFPAPVDYLVKEVLIPLIPGMVDEIVALFNKTEVFARNQKGVA